MLALVSIIIPTYNAENYIEDTLRSALLQTYKNIEIIIIDDGSTDQTLQKIKSFESEKLKIFSQKNQGASKARNQGLKYASGKYIQFLDADDFISLNKIESQVKLLSLNPKHIALCHTIHFIDGSNPKTTSIHHEWFSKGSNNPVDFLIKLYGGGLIGTGYGGMIQPNAWLTPKKIIEEAGPWNEMKNPDDDGEFFCRVLLTSEGFVYSTDAFNYYRKFKTAHNLSAQNSYDASRNLLKSTKLKAEHLLKKTNDQRAKIALSRLFWENAFSFYLDYDDLFLEAERCALKLAPKLKYNNYHNGIPYYLSKIIGWKAVKILKRFKSNYFN